jgi:hypothetical protein
VNQDFKQKQMDEIDGWNNEIVYLPILEIPVLKLTHPSDCWGWKCLVLKSLWIPRGRRIFPKKWMKIFKHLLMCASMKNYSHGQGHCGFSIQYKNKDVRVQAVVVDPIVEILGHIYARAIDEDDIISQQAAPFARPKNAH